MAQLRPSSAERPHRLRLGAATLSRRYSARGETQDGRTVASSNSHATCNGTQPGWTIDLRLQLAPSTTLSQVYQIAVFKAHVYVISFTHRADLPIGSVVQASLDSLCPKTTI